MDEWLIALAGGAIGAVIAALFVQAGRAIRAWGEVSLHDAEATERNRQLVVWADDRTRTLLMEMDRRTGVANQAGQMWSGGHGVSVAHAKADALHDYRDQEWQARLDLMRLRAAEGGWHWLWRRVRGRPAPLLTAREVVEPFLERWREPVTRHSTKAEDAITPVDRTTRTTEEAVAELPALKLN